MLKYKVIIIATLILILIIGAIYFYEQEKMTITQLIAIEKTETVSLDQELDAPHYSALLSGNSFSRIEYVDSSSFLTYVNNSRKDGIIYKIDTTGKVAIIKKFQGVMISRLKYDSQNQRILVSTLKPNYPDEDNYRILCLDMNGKWQWEIKSDLPAIDYINLSTGTIVALAISTEKSLGNPNTLFIQGKDNKLYCQKYMFVNNDGGIEWDKGLEQYFEHLGNIELQDNSMLIGSILKPGGTIADSDAVFRIVNNSLEEQSETIIRNRYPEIVYKTKKDNYLTIISSFSKKMEGQYQLFEFNKDSKKQEIQSFKNYVKYIKKNEYPVFKKILEGKNGETFIIGECYKKKTRKSEYSFIIMLDEKYNWKTIARMDSLNNLEIEDAFINQNKQIILIMNDGNNNLTLAPVM